MGQDNTEWNRLVMVCKAAHAWRESANPEMPAYDRILASARAERLEAEINLRDSTCDWRD